LAAVFAVKMRMNTHLGVAKTALDLSGYPSEFQWISGMVPLQKLITLNTSQN
jgi:hypothetical protein